MVALSRPKATFEACLELFCQNMKTLGRESRRGGMWKPCRRVKHTEPLPKMYSQQYTCRQKQHRAVENARARTTSVSVLYACRLSGPEAGRKQIDGGLGRGVWTYEPAHAKRAITSINAILRYGRSKCCMSTRVINVDLPTHSASLVDHSLWYLTARHTHRKLGLRRFQ